MTIITMCVIASTVVNITAQTTVNGVTFGPNVSVVTQCETELPKAVSPAAKIDELLKKMEAP